MRKVLACLMLAIWIATWKLGDSGKVMMVGPWESQAVCNTFVLWFENHSDMDNGICISSTQFASY